MIGGFLGVLTLGALVAAAAEEGCDMPAQVSAYQEVWNTKDPAAVAGFFTEDADFLMGNFPEVQGIKAIEDWWRVYFSRQEPERRGRFELQSSRCLSDNVAIINILSITEGQMADGEDLPTRLARGTWVLVRQEGKWLIAAIRGFPVEEDEVILKPSPGKVDLRPDIRAFIGAYEAAFNKHDPEAVSGFYEADADLVIHNSPMISGAEEILSWWQSYFSVPASHSVVFIVDEIRMLSDDAAFVKITVADFQDMAEGGTAPPGLARAAWVITREDGKWSIAASRILPSEDDQIVRQHLK